MGNKRRYVPPEYWDSMELKRASDAYWWHDYEKAGKILFGLQRRIIHEPLLGTKEYEDGERKLEAPEQEEKEKRDDDESLKELFLTTAERDYDPNLDPERDSDGYLIG